MDHIMQQSVSTESGFDSSYWIVTCITCTMMLLLVAIYLFTRFYLMSHAKWSSHSRHSHLQMDTNITLHTNDKLKEEKTEEEDSDSETSEIEIQKPHLTVLGAMKFACTNLYVLALAGILFTNSWMTQIYDHTLKDVIHLYFHGDVSAIASYRGKMSVWSSVLTFITMIFLGHNFLRICGWKITAALDPAIFVIGIIAFYMFGIIKSDVFQQFWLWQQNDTNENDHSHDDDALSMWILTWLGFIIMVGCFYLFLYYVFISNSTDTCQICKIYRLWSKD